MKILYICMHNRCLSILLKGPRKPRDQSKAMSRGNSPEAVTNHIAQGKIIARSAGSQPVGEVHPLSLKYLRECDIDTHSLKSQSWDEFEEFAPDIVVTKSDEAQRKLSQLVSEPKSFA